MARIEIQPDAPTLDTELRIRLTEVPAGQAVTVRSSAADGWGRPLGADATFEAGDDGAVDLVARAPSAGTYASADPMGLVWSMSPVPGAPRDDVPQGILPPASLTLTAELESAAIATTTVDRLRLPEDVTRTPIRERSLVGTLFHPIDDGPRPAVILL